MSRLLISAAHKSSGKTTVSVGLCRALARRGLTVQPFKKGPDYIDPMWLAAAAGRACHNLDYYTMAESEITACFQRYQDAAEIALIEGNKGLFDGLALDGSNSNAALAKLLRTPVVLVLDARGMTRGIAPLILGYQAFDQEVNLAGVILNKIGGSRHESKLRAIIEHHTDVPVLGALHRHASLEITERHLGLIPSNESAQAERQINAIADVMAEQIDLDALLAVAQGAPALPPVNLSETFVAPPAPPGDPTVSIAIARDRAFGFYYAGDLEALQQAGARLIPFDTLHDTTLPEADGLLLGGGFPETHLTQLAANQALRQQIRHAIAAGLPTYAECGGLMYLCRSLTWQGQRADMVGAIAADAIMHDRPQGRGYVRLEETTAFPWPSLASSAAPPPHRGEPGIPGHEFHYSSLHGLPPETPFAYRVLRGTGIDGRHDGIICGNTLASYCHLRDAGGHHWPARFVAFIRQNKIW